MLISFPGTVGDRVQHPQQSIRHREDQRRFIGPDATVGRDADHSQRAADFIAFPVDASGCQRNSEKV